MSTTPSRRDYSLIAATPSSPSRQACRRPNGITRRFRASIMKELMQRSDGPAIRDTLIWLAALVSQWRGAALVGGTWWWRAVLLRLRRPLWLFHRFTLARMRPRHGVPDAVDE